MPSGKNWLEEYFIAETRRLENVAQEEEKCVHRGLVTFCIYYGQSKCTYDCNYAKQRKKS